MSGKSTVRDISRQTPTKEEAQAVVDAYAKLETPSMVVAVLGAASLEYELERQLRPKFKRNADPDWARLTGEYGPVGSFAAKINAAYGFGIIDEVLRKNFCIVKDVRNAFAHSKKLIDFDHELVADELNGIKLPARKRTKLYKKLARVKHDSELPKIRFIGLCLILSTEMARREANRFKGQARHYKRKADKLAAQSPFFGALANAMSPSDLGRLGLFGGLASARRPAGPISLAQALAFPGILGKLRFDDDNEGNKG